MYTEQLKPICAPLAENEAMLERYQAHLSEYIEAIDAALMPEAYRKAVENGDAAAAVREAAAYYRKRPDSTSPRGKYSDDIIAAADRAVKGGVTVVGIDHTFENGRMDFYFDATKTLPARNYEWVWQLNRHVYWYDMAAAYRQTQDETYAAAFERQMLDWVAQTTCPEANWNSPGSAWRTIECGIRLLGAWQVAFETFRKSESVHDASLLIMLASMRAQALHLVNHPHYGNWLMMESTGVFAVGALFPEFKESEMFRTIASTRFIKELEDQILPDGMHNELTPDYQNVVWSCAINIHDIAKSKGYDTVFPPRFFELLEKNVRAAILLSTPGFTQPRTNDCYTVPTQRFTGNAQMALPYKPEYEFVNTCRAAGRPPEGEIASAYLPWAGMCAMRSDWGADAAYCLFDVGPLGRMHCHQDKLNINIYQGGEELIFDDGGGTYENSPRRVYGKSAYDHNTVLVDGMGQNRSEPLISDAPIDAGWISCDAFDYARGTYDDGFGENMEKAAVHTRQVRFEKSGFFVVRDDLVSADGNEHEYELLFQVNATSADEVTQYPGAIVSDCGKTYDVLIVPLNGEAESPTSLVSGQTEPALRGWYLGRNEEKPHPALTVSRKSPVCREYTFTSLIVPVRRGDALPEICVDGNLLNVTLKGKKTVIDLSALNA